MTQNIPEDNSLKKLIELSETIRKLVEEGKMTSLEILDFAEKVAKKIEEGIK